MARLYSPSNSYIALQHQVVDKLEEDCRPPEQFKVLFTTDRFKEDDNITFYYMVSFSLG